MAQIIRVEKNNNFTIMANYHLREKDMSLKAIGLLSVILSLPPDWDYSVEGLSAIRKESKNTINSILKELETFGYLERKRIRDERGVFKSVEYVIHEEPCTKNKDVVNPYPKNPDMDNPDLENPDLDNWAQLSTKELSTKELSTKELKKEVKERKSPKKKIKKEPFNINKELSSINNEELKNTLLEFSEMREQIKHPLTATAFKRLMKQLEEYSNGDNTKKIKILSNSIVSGYRGIFPLKENNYSNYNNYQRQNNNSFNNFHQRDYSDEAMSELELELLRRQ